MHVLRPLRRYLQCRSIRPARRIALASATDDPRRLSRAGRHPLRGVPATPVRPPRCASRRVCRSRFRYSTPNAAPAAVPPSRAAQSARSASRRSPHERRNPHHEPHHPRAPDCMPNVIALLAQQSATSSSWRSPAASSVVLAETTHEREIVALTTTLADVTGDARRQPRLSPHPDRPKAWRKRCHVRDPTRLHSSERDYDRPRRRRTQRTGRRAGLLTKDLTNLGWSKAPCRFCGTGCGVMVGGQGRPASSRPTATREHRGQSRPELRQRLFPVQDHVRRRSPDAAAVTHD